MESFSSELWALKVPGRRETGIDVFANVFCFLPRSANKEEKKKKRKKITHFPVDHFSAGQTILPSCSCATPAFRKRVLATVGIFFFFFVRFVMEFFHQISTKISNRGNRKTNRQTKDQTMEKIRNTIVLVQTRTLNRYVNRS